MKGQSPFKLRLVNGLYKKGELVQWERAWEVVVHTGLIFEIVDNRNYESRIKEALHRIVERVQATLDKVKSSGTGTPSTGEIILGKYPLASRIT